MTPPVDLNLYVAALLWKMGLTAVTRATLPWLTALVFLMPETYVPAISLALPPCARYEVTGFF